MMLLHFCLEGRPDSKLSCRATTARCEEDLLLPCRQYRTHCVRTLYAMYSTSTLLAVARSSVGVWAMGMDHLTWVHTSTYNRTPDLLHDRGSHEFAPTRQDEHGHRPPATTAGFPVPFFIYFLSFKISHLAAPPHPTRMLEVFQFILQASILNIDNSVPW